MLKKFVENPSTLKVEATLFVFLALVLRCQEDRLQQLKKSNMWFFGAFIPQILVKKMIQAWDHLIRECWEPIFSPSFCLFACGASTLFVRKSFGVPQSGATKNEKIIEN